MKEKIKNSEAGQKYCIGSPKMVAVPYTGQKEPIVIGTKNEVEKWLNKFWNNIYGKN